MIYTTPLSNSNPRSNVSLEAKVFILHISNLSLGATCIVIRQRYNQPTVVLLVNDITNMSSEVFESVNLFYSTDTKKTPPNIDVTNFTDDDLDPIQFLLSESPKPIPKATLSSQEDLVNDIKLNNLQLFLNPSILSESTNSVSNGLSGSVAFPQQFLNSHSPLTFLNNKYLLLSNELRNNCQLHQSAVQTGDDSLAKLRSMILQNLIQLSEVFVSFQELYNLDLNFTRKLYENFQTWDRRRNKILHKISQIKSSDNSDGAKLASLLDENTSIDDEIVQLEARIESLKAKKKVIASEIQSTSSVLESRSAKYVELFRNLDNQGLQAITSYMNLQNPSANLSPSIIAVKPVDVTFIGNYNPMDSKILVPRDEIPVSNSQNIEPVETPTNFTLLHESTIGMKPYIIPDEPNNSDKGPGPAKTSEPDFRDLNHDHGPSPFEQGYVKGEKLGTTIRNKVQDLIKTMILSIPDKTSKPYQPGLPNIEDASNTISQKLDYDPIKTTLKSRIDALTDLTQKTSKNATLFHKYSLVWQDVTKVLKQQETKLQDQITQSSTLWNDSSLIFMDTLRNTVQQLKVTFEVHKFKLESSDSNLALVSQAISNELRAICNALSMVSKNDHYKTLFADFTSFGFDEYNTNT